MVYTCTYKVCTCLTFLNMYIHVKYMSIPFFQILSRWSGFQMSKLQELADKRNEYPVSSTLIFKYIVTHFNSTFADR